ncbi:MAG: hypothetical protein LBJ11_01370 [Oscillospiraceae bacterium]|jgi:hypothetical protein|nr:hypothetical protein [Oscillospiraceae bacterium]
MKNEPIVRALDSVPFSEAARRRVRRAISEGANKRKEIGAMKKKRRFWIPLTACLLLAVAVATPLLRSKPTVFPFFAAKTSATSAALVSLTEEELLAPRWQDEWEVVAFEGTVRKVRHVRVFFGGFSRFPNPLLLDFFPYAIVEIEVSEVLRGDLAPGDTVRVLVDGYVGGNDVWVEDTDVSSRMTVGTKGIFTPIRYDLDAVHIQNGKTLQLTDLAEYGLPDGTRWAFLEKDGGVLFARWAYPSLEGAENLGDVAAWLRENLQ